LFSWTASLAATLTRACKLVVLELRWRIDEQVVWHGTELVELAGAIKERCAGSREEDIAPMGCEDIGLAVTAGRRNDDFELRHECDLSLKR
jgi:hypothetical protein